MEIKDRLQITIKQYGLTATLFADKIGVQRSSISHILSGRNKPSIDFIVKLNDVFPDLDITWLITGKTCVIKEPVYQQKSIISEEKRDTQLLDTHTKYSEPRRITRIITFYNDNSFEEFASNQL